ncbi:Polyketide cyclase / dehydrase and lipid transport (fragment) [Methylocella tundrae]
MLKTLIYATAMAAVAATPALALKVSKSIEIAAPPEKVWETIGEFCGIADWHPVVEKCELSTRGETQIRTLSLKGGGSIV